MTTYPGVNGITGFVIAEPQAPPFNQQGGPADPRHGNRGERAKPYPWEVVPMGPYPGLMNPDDGIIDSTTNWGLPAGMLGQDPTGDQTPAYHAAPYPVESPALPMADQLDVGSRLEGSSRQLNQSASIHAARTGAGYKRLYLPQMLSRQDEWTGFFNPVTGDDIVPAVPPSIGVAAFGFNVNDHVSNPYAKKNSYGLATSHRHRRYATGSIPGNTLWLRARSRPMVRSFTGQHNFPTSGAFAGDDPGANFSYQGAVLTAMPTEYSSPPQVNLAAAPSYDDTGSVPEITYW